MLDTLIVQQLQGVIGSQNVLTSKMDRVTFKEMAAPDTCCGSGGSFVLTHYDTSASLGRNNVQDIGQTGAGTVATGCPACMMQLLDNLGRSGQHQSVTHYISLLAESYRKEREARQPGGAPSLRPARS